jgi:hypothetical protein
MLKPSQHLALFLSQRLQPGLGAGYRQSIDNALGFEHLVVGGEWSLLGAMMWGK